MKQLILAGLCLSLGASDGRPDYEVPRRGGDAATLMPAAPGCRQRGFGAGAEDWWQMIKDQRLNELVRQALSANTELRVAAPNRKARAQVEVAESQGGFNGGVNWVPSACRSLAKLSCS
uniref:Uncharacterized protein n=1 Tax=Ditylenchus dipsaci TaxID=166011 RepID=A0A915DT82_9BILA